MSRPVHLRASHLGLAFIGGTLGTAAREGLSRLLPAAGGMPIAIVAINLVGAFLLGLLLDALARRGPDEGRRRMLRILLGTGFMGGFTTYSALAADTAGLLGDGGVRTGLAYGLGTVVLGGLATWAGIAIGSLTHRPNPAAVETTADDSAGRPGTASANWDEGGSR
ncbi:MULTISPECIES: CrcB family protein [Brevibacterium]|jgi:CrcB protein|uniref:Fluoride-specific ion channel FluC n=1 Tax=Brevibacterium casei TaxID=33889 RepID=A0A7T4DK18_9MICO|nr:CrcB family protein [Brevibacterium casei]QQB15473.1 CrcB family protein [Brevibacterium casei]